MHVPRVSVTWLPVPSLHVERVASPRIYLADHLYRNTGTVELLLGGKKNT